jgi:hypothetical protein
MNDIPSAPAGQRGHQGPSAQLLHEPVLIAPPSSSVQAAAGPNTVAGDASTADALSNQLRSTLVPHLTCCCKAVKHIIGQHKPVHDQTQQHQACHSMARETTLLSNVLCRLCLSDSATASVRRNVGVTQFSCCAAFLPSDPMLALTNCSLSRCAACSHQQPDHGCRKAQLLHCPCGPLPCYDSQAYGPTIPPCPDLSLRLKWLCLPSMSKTR